jgi:NitT/TauT family transport system substrate-binding protein
VPKPTKLTILAVAAPCVLAPAACGGGGAASASTTQITFSLTPAATSACLKVTADRGQFDDQGLSVKFVPAPPTSSAQIAQILNGQVTAGLGAASALISAVAQKLPVTITNGNDQDYDVGGQTAFAVLVDKKSGITSFPQLEGKTVAVNSLKGSWEISLREAVAAEGGDPDKVKLLAVPFADQGAALKSGRVDAVSTLQPFISMLGRDGLVSIGDPQASALGHPDSTGSVTFMSQKYLASHGDLAKKFVDTLTAGAAWCNAHPDEMRKAIAEFTKVPRKVVDAAPVPKYTTAVGRTDVERWGSLLVKYHVIDRAPRTSDLLWTGAPS